MAKPILIVMAAGMGSRYGGLKQLDPVGQHGEIIVDYSVFDALRAGFSKVIFVIKQEHEADFREVIGDHVAAHVPVEYAFQRLDDLPEGFTVPEGRVKPWGTGHAVLAARHLVDAPFAAINADDFYGAEAFQKLAGFLAALSGNETPMPCAMVGYKLENTLTENGSVSRGVCETGDGKLTAIVERKRIEKTPDGPAYTEDGGESWVRLPGDTTVSMNFWGFPPAFMGDLERAFRVFLETEAKENPTSAEFFLPFVVNDRIRAGEASVQMLHSDDRWFGVTYKADKPTVVAALKDLTAAGKYPAPLWQ